MGMKSDLSVEIKSLDGKQAFPKISKAWIQVISAIEKGLASSGPWAILVGIDFFDPGWWQITGQFHDETLKFIVNILDLKQHSLSEPKLE